MMEKIDIPWIEPTTSNPSTPCVVPVIAHTGKDTFQIRNTGVVAA